MNMMKKFEMLVESVVGFDFLSYDKFGPRHSIRVAKADGYAHQLTEEDIEALNGRPIVSKEKTYKAVVGNWVCTDENLTAEDGKIWMMSNDEFKNTYATTPLDNKTITNDDAGISLKFNHYKAIKEYLCFRLPLNMKTTTWRECTFNPGSYVFIDEDGTCDKYEREDSYMQKKYKKIGEDNEEPTDIVKQQYAEIIGSKDSL